MLPHWLDRLFGQKPKQEGGLTGAILLSADRSARARRAATVDVEDVAFITLRLIDVQNALEERGVHAGDALAVVEQLLAERGPSAVELPSRAGALIELENAAVLGGSVSATRFLEALAAKLPRELAFVRAPLASSARSLGRLFDTPLSSSSEGLTFATWEPGLRHCLGLLQKASDERWAAWLIAPIGLFVAILLNPPYATTFRARGLDPAELLREMVAAMPAPQADLLPRPKDVPSVVGAALYAVFLRAERAAIDDLSEVRLRHALYALHAEPELAPWVERLLP